MAFNARALITFTTLVLAGRALANTYTLSTSTIGADFYTDYTWEAIADPTNGVSVKQASSGVDNSIFVRNYVDLATAQSTGLAQVDGDVFLMFSDSSTVLSSTGPGRNSQRIQSNNAYGTHVAVIELFHMPQGLATWPAFWEYGPNWPNGGEIDIIEGVNDEAPNQSTLHTGPGCTMPSTNSGITGFIGNTDCNANDDGNAGCGIQNNKEYNYGPLFNDLGGGWYAMEKTDDGINVWFWSRDDTTVPADLSTGAQSIDTSNWGEPYANFPTTDCDIASEFGPQNIVINLTFCGDWAGAVFNADGGSGDCDTYVEQNPGAFADAYWEINFVNVYE